MFVATLVHPRALAPDLVASARAALDTDAPVRWLEPERVADIAFAAPSLEEAQQRLRPLLEAADIIVQPSARRAKRLLVADMDSTMIDCECIDELADFAGLKEQVSAITERAMRGELDFAGALAARVALLAGLRTEAVEICLRERVRPNPGAATLIATMRAHGARTVLVSGGFTAFAEPVGRALGFDRVVANRLTVADGKLSGAVEEPIVDASTKLRLLLEEAEAGGLARHEVLAIGDGANDIPMLQAAGLGVAYRGKPAVVAAAHAALGHADLTALLHAQAIPRAQWVQRAAWPGPGTALTSRPHAP